MQFPGCGTHNLKHTNNIWIVAYFVKQNFNKVKFSIYFEHSEACMIDWLIDLKFTKHVYFRPFMDAVILVKIN